MFIFINLLAKIYLLFCREWVLWPLQAEYGNTDKNRVLCVLEKKNTIYFLCSF